MTEPVRNSVLESAEQNTEGPSIWRNWQKSIGSVDPVAIVEFMLFTDAWMIAESSHGPYEFLNPVPTIRPGGEHDLKPGVAVRLKFFQPPEIGDMSKTRDEHYHGGWIVDEIAALASLALGARFMAGPVERDFFPGKDPLGRPRSHTTAFAPHLPPMTTRPQIPWLRGNRDLRDLSITLATR